MFTKTISAIVKTVKRYCDKCKCYYDGLFCTVCATKKPEEKK
jgi:hypothetical protein